MPNRTLHTATADRHFDRGKSCNLSVTGRSDISNQRLIQVVTTFSCAIPNSRAIAIRLVPSSAIRIIFARRASLWLVVCFLIMRSSSARESIKKWGASRSKPHKQTNLCQIVWHGGLQTENCLARDQPHGLASHENRRQHRFGRSAHHHSTGHGFYPPWTVLCRVS